MKTQNHLTLNGRMPPFKASENHQSLLLGGGLTFGDILALSLGISIHLFIFSFLPRKKPALPRYGRAPQRWEPYSYPVSGIITGHDTGNNMFQYQLPALPTPKTRLGGTQQ